MKFPSKLYSYKESIIHKMVLVLDAIESEEVSVKFLRLKVKNEIASESDFIEALVCLFALKRIKFNEKKETIRLCCTK